VEFKDHMTEQLVRLKGHQFDLEALSEHFTSDDLNVRRDEDDHYYLRSTDFDQMSDSSAVEERGRELLEHIKGLQSSCGVPNTGPSNSMRPPG
jgi:hypothetical protein